MKIIIVGGGTSGWVSLAYLAATIDAELTIIHSEEVDTLGVGESTTPTIKHVAETCGIDEVQWMRDSKASFKYGNEFLDFNYTGSRWMHSFDDLIPGHSFHTPMTEFGKNIFKKEVSSVEYFLKKRSINPKRYDIDWFNNSQGGCEFLIKNKLSPYTKKGNSNFSRFPGYSYHINAQEFGNSLRKHTPKEKYTEIKGHVSYVKYNENGVEYITLSDGRKMSADLFIDCTGFNRVLIGEMSKFNPYKDLLNNSAIWGPVHIQSFRPSTLSIAQPHGWIWETPTWGQIGSGYVFCDNFITVEEAENHIRNHWNKKGLIWNPIKSVKFTSGRLENVAVKNVVSNGLGQSFIEPLEATSIMIICVTIRNVSKLIKKHKGWSHKSSKVLSSLIKTFLEETKDFVLGHYTLSNREDTDYWKKYKDENSLEVVSNMVEKKLRKEWVNHAETNLNGYNWASMLIGYEKDYLGKLPEISEDELFNYEFFTKQLIENYTHHYSKNLSVKERLEFINQP